MKSKVLAMASMVLVIVIEALLRPLLPALSPWFLLDHGQAHSLNFLYAVFGKSTSDRLPPLM